MLLFETLLLGGGYNSGVALKWPRVQQPSSISNILQGSERFVLCLLSSFHRSRRSYFSSPIVRLFLSLFLSVYLYPSVYPRCSQLFFAVASSQSSFMPPGGEDLITYGEWIRPVVLPVPQVSRRCLKFSLLSLFLSPSLSFSLFLSFSVSLLLFSRYSFSSYSYISRSPAPFSKDSFHDARLRASRKGLVRERCFTIARARLCHVYVINVAFSSRKMVTALH